MQEIVPGEKSTPAYTPDSPRTLTWEVSRGVGILYFIDIRFKFIDFQL